MALEDGHFNVCLEADVGAGKQLGVSASVPDFSTEHSETGLEKALELGWCLGILISSLSKVVSGFRKAQQRSCNELPWTSELLWPRK